MSISGEEVDNIRSLIQESETYNKICSTLDLDMVDVLEVTFSDVDSSETQALDSDKYEPYKNQTVIIELYLNQQMRFTEIAQLLDCHPETAKQYVTRLANPRITKV